MKVAGSTPEVPRTHSPPATVAQTAGGGLEFRFTPAQPVMSALGGRVPPDAGFGCEGNPDMLRVERRGPDEIAFPGCNEFPSALKRCTAGAR